MTKVRPIAIHLPQFHPIPENDLWWGKGFTEWTNVTKAKPLFPGHYQPHLPSDLGFYDLRQESTRIAQAELAKSYGIYGFCYYHYWFNGKRLLYEPVDAILQSKKPDFPFMFCWANENWNRSWDGNHEEILMEQQYSLADDIEHMQYLCREVFSDSRYIRVDGKPFFLVYRPKLFPDIKETISKWREEALKFRMELYLGYVQGFDLRKPPEELGFDVAVDFQPNFYTEIEPKEPLRDRLFDKAGIRKSPYRSNTILSYSDYAENQKNQPQVNYKRYPAITPMWDNSARRKRGAFILKESHPDIYESWLRQIIKNFKPYSEQENFLFINAWNEWAEGNHLEPCIKWERKYLEATRRALEENG